MSAHCRRCMRPMDEGLLACPYCHALVHAEALARISAEASGLESDGRFREARSVWLSALELLPGDAKQAAWIVERAQSLHGRADVAPEPQHPPGWTRKLGPLAPLALLLLKGKGLLALFKLNFVFSLISFMGFYWALFGVSFGIGFALLVLWHEMGHFIDIRRRGLPADMPVFLPGLGAYVRWRALGVSDETRAMISLAGPFAGWIAAVLCGAAWSMTGNGLWAALGRAGAWLNAANLVPVWVLDGGQASEPLSKGERILILSVALILWFVSRESVFFLIVLGAAWRAFMSPSRDSSSSRVTLWYLALLTAFAVTLRALPYPGGRLQ